MNIAVVDASVAVQWLIPEQNTSQAMRLLREVAVLAVPDLIYSEVGNALWKRVQRNEIDMNQGSLLIEEFLRLPLDVYPSTELLTSAFQIAHSVSATVYDALYLALSQRLHAPLVSADQRLLSQARAYRPAVQLIAIGDVEQYL